jgi:hypothetical protein
MKKIRAIPLPEKMPFGIREHHGWYGAFTTQEVLGAGRNGTKVVKVKEDPNGDTTPLGTVGTVLGSIYEPRVYQGPFYFVEWDDKPMVAVGVIDWKIAPQFPPVR